METLPSNEERAPAETLEAQHWHDVHISDVKSRRVELDGVLQIMKSMPVSPQMNWSICKIQEGIMWLGMELKRLGEANPYPNSYKPENTIIEPTAQGLKL